MLSECSHRNRSPGHELWCSVRTHRILAGIGFFLICLPLLLPTSAGAISDRRDQPTRADIPPGTRPPSDIAPPETLKPRTKVMQKGSGLSGGARSPRVNPLERLKRRDRTSGESRRHRRQGR